MKKFLFIPALSLAAMTAYSSSSLKQKAYSAVKTFFQVTEQRLVFKGRYIDTAQDYGKTCQLIIDWTQPGQEFVTLKGEYTPSSSIGDGIYFRAATETFTDVLMNDDKLILEQKLTDTFSTWTKTTLQLSKHANTLDVSLQQTSSFLFFTDTVEKRCVVTLARAADLNLLDR